MESKVIFGLLILCGFMLQGFCTSLEENGKSTDLHIRKKRVIGESATMREARFLTSVIANGRNHCPASLLTNSVAITSAECFNLPTPTSWQIRAGFTNHHVLNVIPYGNYNSSHPAVNNLALVFFHPPIISNRLNRPVKIYNGNIANEDHFPIAYNWKHFTHLGHTQQSDDEIKKVNLQFISYEYCHNYYLSVVSVGNICTQSSIPTQYCHPLDSGAPLVINNELLGIFAFRGRQCLTNPDVFMNLLDHNIRLWIHLHVPTLRLF